VVLGAALTAALLVAGLPAAAEDWEVTPFAGYRWGGSVDSVDTGGQVNFDSSPLFGVTVGRFFGEEKRFELTWNHQSTELGSDAYGLEIDYLQFAGVYEPLPKGKAGGYVLASAGLARFDPSSGSGAATYFAGSIGGGGRFRLGERTSWKVEGRLWGVLTAAGAGLHCSGGCVFQFSGSGLLQFEITTGLAIGF
jgi:hypothetical protein